MIDKATFLKALECHARGWYSANVQDERDNTPTAGEQMRMAEGQDVHRRARSTYPSGQFAGSPAATQALLKKQGPVIVFEAAFESGDFATRADILIRKGSKVRLLEIKSSLHTDNEVDAEHIDDLAYTAMVLLMAGQRIDTAELVLLSRDWRLGAPPESLFVTTDHTAKVLARAAEFQRVAPAVAKAVLRAQRPTVKPLFACKRCEEFENRCLGKGIADPIFDLPRLSEKKFDALAEMAVLTIRGIPATFDLTPNQARIREAVVKRKPSLDREARSELLSKVRWPAVYLDFETLKTAIPLWSGVAPHEQVVTQYSAHGCDRLGTVTRHRAFLADASRDDRRTLAERLLEDTKGTGSVIAYHAAFEKTVIADLADRFPKLRADLLDINDRMFDLEHLFTKAYYHPTFRGSSSIKYVLPVLIPSMSYEGLPINNGDDAIAAFAKLASGQCTPRQQHLIRTNLLEYCHQDTLAMVRLHARIAEMG